MSRAIDTRDETVRTLKSLAAAHEAIDWSDIDGISVAEVAVWTARLKEAKNRHENTTDAKRHPDNKNE